MMLVNIETASPPFKVAQQKAAEELKRRMGQGNEVGRLIDMAARFSGIENRCIVVPDAEENIKEKFYTSETGEYLIPDTKSRMDLYEEWSVKLTTEAVEKLFSSTGTEISEIDRLITVSCTGFFAPGIDYELMNRIGLPKSVKRTHIGFMGCAAALIGVNSVWESLSRNNGNASNTLLVAVELCSLHLQTEPTRDNILANMIFADGAAAGLFTNDEKNKPVMEIVSVNSTLFDNSAEFMGWKIGNYGFEMMLSSELPKIILETAAPTIMKILSDNGINKDEIKHWALHPGGRAILDALQRGLALSDEQLFPSREVLRKYGNMSSASILFVLKEILNGISIKKDDYCCAIAFGPGLTMEVVLFKGV